MLTRINSTLGNRKGFTLVEMAIVLVIIGLIMGAVLKGGDLINSGKEKKLRQEIDAITLAFYGAQEKSIPITYVAATGVIDPAAITALKVGGYLNMFEVAGGDTLKSKAYPAATFKIEKLLAAAAAFPINSTVIRIAGIPLEDELLLDSKFDDNNSKLGDISQSTVAAAANAYDATEMFVRLK